MLYCTYTATVQKTDAKTPAIRGTTSNVYVKQFKTKTTIDFQQSPDIKVHTIYIRNGKQELVNQQNFNISLQS
mgnify:CR=1 FL=1